MLNNLVLLDLILWGIFGFTHILTSGIVFKIFRTRYPDVWDKLGRPGYFYNSTSQSRKDLKSFVDHKEYLKLNDPQFKTWLILNDRLSLMVSLCAVAFLILAIIYYSGMGLSHLFKR